MQGMDSLNVKTFCVKVSRDIVEIEVYSIVNSS
jgi:hypothetical protein